MATPWTTVIENLKRHRLPPRPDNINKTLEGGRELWAIYQDCWKTKASDRPTAKALLNKIQKIMRRPTRTRLDSFRLLNRFTSIDSEDKDH